MWGHLTVELITKNFWSNELRINFKSIQNKVSWGCSRMGRDKKVPLPKICHTYPAMMKLGIVISYLKKIQNHIWITRHTTWVLLTSALFHRKSVNFAKSKNAVKIAFWYIISDSFNFSLFLIFLEIFLINMAVILIMSTKMATLGLLKIKLFWNKCYDFIISVHDVTRKVITWLKLYCRCAHVSVVW